ILRVLQNREFYRVGGKEPVRVDVRVIAATNQDLQDLMARKLFREDLFYRLNVIHIHLPPLRERPEDIPLLANHFLCRFSDELARGKTYLSPAVEQIFKNYSWRGNIRELENAVKRGLALASSGPVLPEHLPPQILEDARKAGTSLEDWEKRLGDLVREYMAQTDWDKDRDLHDRLTQALEKQLFQILLEKTSGKQVVAAKVLGINRNTLKRKIDAMNIQPKKRGRRD
ncbi:MAG: sigma-54-dependent Fis family transcriptional regulator, partial [Nitrospinae bacterium]|nr:sigma-54-dependent Fis family transcriptional regulator [Nitrospinota bacterium]